MDPAFSLAVLSQIRELGQMGYKALSDSEQAMAEQQEKYTPEDPNTEIVADFEAAVTARAAADQMSHNPGLYRINDLDQELNSLAKNYGLPRRQILCVLKAAGCQRHCHGGRYYGTRAAAAGYDPEAENSPAAGWGDGMN